MRVWLKSRRMRGFTLVELIMVIVLLGILAAVGSNMLSDNFTSTAMVNSGNAMEAEARYAMDRLVREMRQVQYVSASQEYNVTTPAANPATGLVFVNTDGTTVTISSSTASGVTSVNLGYPTVQTLVSQVSTFSLTFRDASGTTIATLADIRSKMAFIDVVLHVQDGKSGQAISQSMRVALRSH